MQARFEMSEGKSALQEILEAFPTDSAHWNEAQNRFQFVDRLLRDVLGWEHPYIEVEKIDELGGKSDYALGVPIKAILEAKKEAVVFDFLPSGPPRIVRKLRPLIEACKNLNSAVSQVLPYCMMHGAQIAIVCNGPQLVMFQAYIPGMSPIEGECYVFNGFDSYVSNFALLWRLLSPEGVLENRALRQLSLSRTPRIPPKAVSAIPEPNAYRYRSGFQENLRTISSVLLEHIEDNPAVKSEFYRECYVPLEANNRHLLLSKKIISARYRRNSESGSAPAALQARIQGGRVHIEDGDASAVIGSRPMVVIGDVGVGKTSFFENLFEQLEQEEKARTYYIYLNLGEEATLSNSVKDVILNRIPLILRSTYGTDIDSSEFVEKVYSDELASFDRSVQGQLKEIDALAYAKAKIEFLSDKMSQRDNHIKISLLFLSRSLGKQILMIIDNADQRDFDTQQQAFLIAQEFAALRRMFVFIALRPSTFYQSKLSGALSGYQNRILTISPPPADEVLRKRIAFAVRVAEGKAAPAALEGIYLNLRSVVHFLNATLRSIRANSQIRTFLSNITGGNTRLVIELISSFCGSPNVECERIVRIEEQEGNYQVPLHEFTKHSLLGEYTYFNPLSSLVACNIFDVVAPDPREHFLCPILIAYLSSPLGVRDNDGFVHGSAILGEMSRLGFDQDQTSHALRRLARRRLIETPQAHYREIVVPDDTDPLQFFYRSTSIGLYHIRFWAGSFAFLDAVSTDTPVFDDTARGVIFSVADSLDIAQRYKKAEIFKQYLESKWHEGNYDVNYYNFQQVTRDQIAGFNSVARHLEHGPRQPRSRSGRRRS